MKCFAEISEVKYVFCHFCFNINSFLCFFFIFSSIITVVLYVQISSVRDILGIAGPGDAASLLVSEVWGVILVFLLVLLSLLLLLLLLLFYYHYSLVTSFHFTFFVTLVFILFV